MSTIQRFPVTIVGSETYALDGNSDGTIHSLCDMDNAGHSILTLGPNMPGKILQLGSYAQLAIRFETEWSHMQRLNVTRDNVLDLVQVGTPDSNDVKRAKSRCCRFRSDAGTPNVCDQYVILTLKVRHLAGAYSVAWPGAGLRGISRNASVQLFLVGEQLTYVLS